MINKFIKFNLEIEIEIFILLHNQAVTFILYKKNYKIGTAHPAWIHSYISKPDAQ